MKTELEIALKAMSRTTVSVKTINGGTIVIAKRAKYSGYGSVVGRKSEYTMKFDNDADADSTSQLFRMAVGVDCAINWNVGKQRYDDLLALWMQCKPEGISSSALNASQAKQFKALKKISPLSRSRYFQLTTEEISSEWGKKLDIKMSLKTTINCLHHYLRRIDLLSTRASENSAHAVRIVKTIIQDGGAYSFILQTSEIDDGDLVPSREVYSLHQQQRITSQMIVISKVAVFQLFIAYH
jgi:hypothetical protein